MHQHISIIISIANGTLRILLMCLVALSGFSHDDALTAICAQQFLAKENIALPFILSTIASTLNRHNGDKQFPP
jgi:hypothetical protein